MESIVASLGRAAIKPLDLINRLDNNTHDEGTTALTKEEIKAALTSATPVQIVLTEEEEAEAIEVAFGGDRAMPIPTSPA